MSRSATPKRAPLEGIKVLDITHVMAGSYCGLLLAEMGADVVKVERPGGGDDLRRNQERTGGAFRPYDAVNHSKRSLALDLRDPRGAEVLRRLAERADVLVENYRPGSLARLGLGYDDLASRNPGLVYCSISGFGSTGPYRDRAGFDLVAQGMSGIMSVTGEPGRPPVIAGVPVADLNAASFAALGILSALLHRATSGAGQFVDTSLHEAAIAYTVWESALWFDVGKVPGPLGSTHRLASPYGAFATSDGHLTLGAANQANWERLCIALDRSDLLADPRFADSLERLRHRSELTRSLEAVFAADTTDAWVEKLNGAGVPCGPVYTMDRVYADPQACAREMAVELGEVEGRARRAIGPPVKLSATPWRVQGPAAAFGEHSREVLRDFGFGAREVQDLIDAGVVNANGSE